MGVRFMNNDERYLGNPLDSKTDNLAPLGKLRGVKKNPWEQSNRTGPIVNNHFHGSTTVAVIKIEKKYFTIQLRFSISTHGY